MFRIIAKEDLASTDSKFIIHAPLVARKRKAGSFVVVRVIENGERIPLTIVDSKSAKGTITLIVQAIREDNQIDVHQESRRSSGSRSGLSRKSNAR